MRSAIAAALLLLVTGCGTLEGPRTGTVSPPTDALARWKDFPADQVPRPIVLLGYNLPGLGFDTSGEKIAYMCGEFALAVGLPVEVPKESVASWPDGTKYTYPAVSASDAFADMIRTAPNASMPICTGVAPLPVTAARFAAVGLRTDRGTAQISAWNFKASGAWVELAQPAVPTSAIWGGGLSQWVGEGATVSSDGRVITFSFIGSPPEGACGGNYTGVVAESVHAVAIATQATPGRIQAGPGVCPAVGAIRTVTVQLASPLGGRVLVDASGNVVAVAPAPVL